MIPSCRIILFCGVGTRPWWCPRLCLICRLKQRGTEFLLALEHRNDALNVRLGGAGAVFGSATAWLPMITTKVNSFCSHVLALAPRTFPAAIATPLIVLMTMHQPTAAASAVVLTCRVKLGDRTSTFLGAQFVVPQSGETKSHRRPKQPRFHTGWIGNGSASSFGSQLDLYNDVLLTLVVSGCLQTIEWLSGYSGNLRENVSRGTR